MIKQTLFDILLTKVKQGVIEVEDIKDNNYKQAVITELGGD